MIRPAARCLQGYAGRQSEARAIHPGHERNAIVGANNTWRSVVAVRVAEYPRRQEWYVEEWKIAVKHRSTNNTVVRSDFQDLPPRFDIPLFRSDAQDSISIQRRIKNERIVIGEVE